MPTEDNPIGALQELSQARGGQPTPHYVLQSVSGEAHCPHFVYEASWADLRVQGEGANKVRIVSTFNIKPFFFYRRKPKSVLPRIY